MLHFLLTGKPPFSRFGSALEKMLAHVQDDPEPIRNIRPEVPVELAEVLARMMAKKPADRFATPAEVAAALKPFARGETIVDENPDIVHAPAMRPMVDVPTSPIADARTEPMLRPAMKRRPIRKRRKARFEKRHL